jgi:hypothetical protein
VRHLSSNSRCFETAAAQPPQHEGVGAAAFKVESS